MLFFGGDFAYLLPYGLNIRQDKIWGGKCYGIHFVDFYLGGWGRSGEYP